MPSALLPHESHGDPRLAATAERLMGIVLAELRGYGLEGSSAVHAARCVWATMHGFAALQVTGGFGLPEQTDVTRQQLVRIVVTGLRGCVTCG